VVRGSGVRLDARAARRPKGWRIVLKTPASRPVRAGRSGAAEALFQRRRGGAGSRRAAA